MAIRTEYGRIEPYQTKDGSRIRELMHPDIHENREQSLAEATVPEGSVTQWHRHHKSEEIYHITAGRGRMSLGDEELEVKTSDTVAILPGTAHRIANTDEVPLKILCCCSPPYGHEDTELLPDGPMGENHV